MKTKPTTYTEEYVKQELDLMLKTLRDRSEVVYLGELIEPRPYSVQRFSEWKDMTPGISESIQKIKNILETRAVVGGLKNQLSANMTKFHLINNFSWQDKTETDITTGGKELNLLVYRPEKYDDPDK